MKRFHNLTRILSTITLFCILTLAGCLERSENLKVRPDGQITASIKVTADQPSELTPGRVPSQLSGWTVNQAPGPDGKKIILTAEQTFPSVKLLPANDATPGDLLAKTYVQTQTTLKIDKRSDATYYQFRRVYSSRLYAWLAYIDERPGSQEFKAVIGKPADKVTVEEWQRALAFGVQTQTLKKLEQARVAIIESNRDFPQDKWLIARQNVLDSAQNADTTKLAIILKARKPDGSDGAQASIAQEIQALEDNLDKSILDALTLVGYDADKLRAFKGLMNKAKSTESATSDARGTTFKITVELPGQPIGSNASQSSANSFTWEFRGDAFCDRDLELLATTKLK